MLFSNFFIHSRHFIDQNKLLVKQMQAPNESFTSWLYRYLVVRLHFLILLVYSGITAHFDQLKCEHNAALEPEVIPAICMFNYTYVIRGDFFWEEDHLISDTFQSAVRPGLTNQERHYLRYYANMFQILATLLLFNIIANTVLASLLYFQNKFFTCEHECCLEIEPPVCYYRISPERLECQIRQMTGFITFRPTKWLFYVSYICAEIPPILAIIASVSLLDVTFDGKFLSLGWDLVKNYYAPKGTVNPLRYIFPVLTKCQGNFESGSGELSEFDSFCLLSYNYLNQGIFAILWFLYAVFFVAFTIRLLAKLPVIASYTFRQYLIWHMLYIGPSQRRVFSIVEYILLVYAKSWDKRIMAKAISILLKTNNYSAWVAENEPKAKSPGLFSLMSRKFFAWEEKNDEKSKLNGRVQFPFSGVELKRLLNKLTREPKPKQLLLEF